MNKQNARTRLKEGLWKLTPLQSICPNPLRACAAYSTIQGGRLDIRTPVRADSTHQVRKGTPGGKVLKSRGPFALKIDTFDGRRKVAKSLALVPSAKKLPSDFGFAVIFFLPAALLFPLLSVFFYA